MIKTKQSIFFIILMAVLNCCRVEKAEDLNITFSRRIVNNSGHEVELKVYNERGTAVDEQIEINDTFRLDGSCTFNAATSNRCDKGYYDFGSFRDDSANIIFDNMRCQKFYYVDPFNTGTCPRNILPLGGYNCGYSHIESLNISHEILAYTIIEEDYENAELIEN